MYVCVYVCEFVAMWKRESFTFKGVGIGVYVMLQVAFISFGIGDRSMRMWLQVSSGGMNVLGV